MYYTKHKTSLLQSLSCQTFVTDTNASGKIKNMWTKVQFQIGTTTHIGESFPRHLFKALCWFAEVVLHCPKLAVQIVVDWNRAEEKHYRHKYSIVQFKVKTERHNLKLVPIIKILKPNSAPVHVLGQSTVHWGKKYIPTPLGSCCVSLETYQSHLITRGNNTIPGVRQCMFYSCANFMYK